MPDGTQMEGATQLGDIRFPAVTAGEFAARWNAASPASRERWVARFERVVDEMPEAGELDGEMFGRLKRRPR